MPTLLELVLAAIIMTLGFYAVVHGTWYVLTKGIPWLWGLLRIVKNKEKQTIETPWSEADKRYFESLKEAVKYHDV